MRKAAILCFLLITSTVRATVRCPGLTHYQALTVDSGQNFTLPIKAVPGVLDYDVVHAADWTLNNSETWNLRGNLVTDTVRVSATNPPAIVERLYNTDARASFSAYYVVIARNDFGGDTFVPCAQDFLVTVNPAPGLTPDSVRSVIPVAGSLRGANNSVYKTLLTLRNPWSSRISGRIVFHPSGRSGAANDLSVTYSMEQNEVVTWDDVLVAMGTSGIGSLDVVPDVSEFGNYPMPTIRARILSLGANGGSFDTDVPAIGMTSREFGAVWTNLATAEVLADDRNGGKRLALGVRTLAEPVNLTVYLLGGDTLKATVTKSFPADYHEQQPLSAWFGSSVQTNDRILFLATRKNSNVTGGAIVYLAETDNVTNDVSVVIPRFDLADATLRQPIVQCSVGCNLLVR